jgi:hypothetical protein
VRKRPDKLVRELVLKDAAPFVPLMMTKRLHRLPQLSEGRKERRRPGCDRRCAARIFHRSAVLSRRTSALLQLAIRSPESDGPAIHTSGTIKTTSQASR